MSSKKLPKKPSNRPLILIGLASQMGLTIYICVWLGKKLDAYYHYEKVFVVVFTLLGVFLSIFTLIRQLKKLNL
jgi:F0F1-type ATP synthase assembly protein I